MRLKITILIIGASLTLAACEPKPANQYPQATKAFADTTQNPQPQAVKAVADTFYIPQPTGYVNDFAHVYTAWQTRTLDSLLTAYESQTSVEIAIATFNDSMIGNQIFEDYTKQVANKWGIGKKHKNNGILISISPDIHRMYINNGNGIASHFSDNETKAVIDSIFIPHFKKGDYYQGTLQGVLAIIKKLP